MSRPTKCFVDLKAFKKNISNIKLHTAPSKLLVLVKADAYGHGLIHIGAAAQEAGADYLGVACVEEGLQLKNAGITLPVLCLGPIPRGSERDCVEYSIEQTVSKLNEVERLEEYCRAHNKQCNVHIKIETGMHRTGVRAGDELAELIDAIKQTRHITVKGVFTHFATADEADGEYTLFQAREFNKAVQQVKNAGFDPIVHCANSGAVLDYPELNFDMVRAGIICYGYYPSRQVEKSIEIYPVLSFKTAIVEINRVKKGEGIGYGRTFVAPRDMTVAVLPVGYGDGYKRALSNKGYVLINGKKAGILGNVCMDMTMVDITDISAKLFDEAVLIGKQGNEVISADTLADLCGTISYEIMLSITARVPKIYHE